MFASRLTSSLRALPRQASAVRMARRGYAEAAGADGKLQLSLVLPHQKFINLSSTIIWYSQSTLIFNLSPNSTMYIHLNRQSLYSSAGVIQVNIPAATGDMGVLANHVASVEALRAGVVEVIEENGQAGKKWFVSSGFATVHGNNTLTINAVEAYPLDNFSPENIRSGLADANRVLSSSAPESEKAEARIEVEVFEGLQAALAK
ncbi:F-type H+-transporting ATPase subunit delta [Kwoniella mangroviensis CBS 10435]|uniref:ATP synthase subunit delta, mitochondrial n=1 Tax=Kwoniella mangroviensis CBS 10435 TaxID=1331196 RepID=A0A1B9IHV9_9TREE|nr:F-type H+-transporting ATPase subunit delta [Kwoniella mangroviensis CBS 8507]OCF55115.1 F-type H+-transporting ATPase subunit delta [Kwoniella mangroviensis CBS 10435]OCF65766.1 F-type H+-transporting ATPase subunit delta [Kwoniella mangroviensis CBS 8507]OCF72163.1 F-type H+-transporting ATPase subunit delta [Kwoniella mangroviensis CBS 8886]